MSKVMCACNPAILEAKFRNRVGLIIVEGKSSAVGGWIVWLPLIQHKERSVTKYWDLTENKNEPRFKDGLN